MNIRGPKKQLPLNIVRFRYLLMLLVGLVVADGLLSEFLVNSGMGREGNPFLRDIMATGDFILVKIAGSLLSALLLAAIYRRQPKMAVVTTWCFIAIYTGIAYWNIGGMLLSVMSFRL